MTHSHITKVGNICTMSQHMFSLVGHFLGWSYSASVPSQSECPFCRYCCVWVCVLYFWIVTLLVGCTKFKMYKSPSDYKYKLKVGSTGTKQQTEIERERENIYGRTMVKTEMQSVSACVFCHADCSKGMCVCVSVWIMHAFSRGEQVAPPKTASQHGNVRTGNRMSPKMKGKNVVTVWSREGVNK